MGPPTDSELGRFDEARRHRGVKYDPTINLGTMLEIVVIVGGGLGVFFALQKDQATQGIRLTGVEQAQVVDKAENKEKLKEITGEVRDVKKTLDVLVREVTIINTRAELQQAQQVRGKP